MKISYQHPETENRTSITLDDNILRLWAIVNDIEGVIDSGMVIDDFMSDEVAVKLLKSELYNLHQQFVTDTNTFPTFTSYVENFILRKVQDRLIKS